MRSSVSYLVFNCPKDRFIIIVEVRLIIGGFEDDAHPRGAVRVGAGDDDGGWVDARLLGDSLADAVGLSSCDPEEVRRDEDETPPRFLEAENQNLLRSEDVV